MKLRLHAEPVSRFAVSRSSFLPPPRVDSAVVRLERRDDPSDLRSGTGAARVERASVLADAAAAADAAFAQRRKTIRNSLCSALGASRASVERALEASGIDGTVRAETLEPAAYIELGAALRSAGLL